MEVIIQKYDIMKHISINLQKGGKIGNDDYECYENIIPRMVSGGILVADNAINHYESLKPMIDRALSDERVDALVVPIGKGELVCRKR